MKNSKLAIALIAGSLSVALCAPATFAARSTGNNMMDTVTTVKTDEAKVNKVESVKGSHHKKAKKAAAVKHHKSSKKHHKSH